MNDRIRRLLAVASLTALLTTLDAQPVAAARGGGARSHVVGRGDIVTSILGWHTSPSRSTDGRPPRCRWRTFGDAELEWLVSVTAQLAAAGVAPPVPDHLRSFLGSGVIPDGDVQARLCDGQIVDVRFVDRGPRDPIRILERRMITHLPAPAPIVSPPPTAAVPIGQPVFFSIAADDWVEVVGSITVDDLSADVRARPVSMRIITGDPGAPTTTCDGPGVAFDPGDPASPRRQAADVDSCTVTYATATAGRRSTRSERAGAPGAPGAPGAVRPDSWLGTVTVLWQAEWRSGDGAWTSLGTIPRTRLIERSVREVTTTLERP